MGDAAIIGAGVLGLAIAQRLSDRGDNVTLFEASPNLGGLAGAWDIGGVTWDQHYHVTLASDARTRQLLRTIRLDDDVRWVHTKSGLYAAPQRGVRSFSNAMDLLKLPTLSVVDKLRVGATILAGSRVPEGERMEDRTAREWLTTWSGRRAFDRFWLPLLRAKLGDEWQQASAAFVVSTMRRLYSARGGVLRAEQLGYVPGGYARILDRYAARLTDAGVKINVDAPVRRVYQSTNGIEVQLDDASATFDRVVVTTAAPLAAELCPTLTDGEKARLRAVRYVGVVCASLLLSRKLSSRFMTYVADPVAPFSSVIEMSSFIDTREVGGWNLIYLPTYTSADDPLFDLDDATVRDRFLPYLRQMYPEVRATDVRAFRVSAAFGAFFAVPTLGYSRSMPSTATSIPGLQLIGSANLPFATLNVNDTLSLVQELR